MMIMATITIVPAVSLSGLGKWIRTSSESNALTSQRGSIATASGRVGPNTITINGPTATFRFAIAIGITVASSLLVELIIESHGNSIPLGQQRAKGVIDGFEILFGPAGEIIGS